jgi:uncharacterized protein YdcH (DUF465 family)
MFMNRARATRDLDALVRKHRDLDDQVDELEQRRYLTPIEQQRVASLKKLRLAARDQIAAIRRQAAG